MDSRPVNVDGVRRLLNVSPEEISEADLRRAVALTLADLDTESAPAEVEAMARRFAETMNRWSPL